MGDRTDVMMNARALPGDVPGLAGDIHPAPSRVYLASGI
jgi:hypothetical protein